MMGVVAQVGAGVAATLSASALAHLWPNFTTPRIDQPRGYRQRCSCQLQSIQCILDCGFVYSRRRLPLFNSVRRRLHR